MKTIAALSATALALAGAIAVAGITSAGATDATLLSGAVVHKAGQGFDYEVGTKHAVGYYTKAGSECALTVIISDRVGEDEIPAQGARLRVSVAGGSDALLETADGKGLQVSCAAGAAHVTVTPLGSDAI